MRKIFLVVSFVAVFLVGCGNMSNTPTAKVENFMSKYQRLDSEVLSQLDMVVAARSDLTDEQKENYRNLMERQYQNMSYKIKDENANDKNATVTLEVEVYDYRSALNNSEQYYESNKKEFEQEDGTLDNKKYWDYKISEMVKTEDRIKNEIIFTLHKDNDKWILEDISDIDREKLHGVFAG
ncbi:MAG: hypothetical protein IKO49_08230 [Bacilli bacterium]|nr:hypothetical protein [Bacilli bacterium]